MVRPVTVYDLEKLKITVVDWVDDSASDEQALDDTELSLEEIKKQQREKFNPYHVPAGSPEGGRFTTAPGAAGGAGSVFRQDLINSFDEDPDTWKEMGKGVKGLNTTGKWTTEEGEEVFVKIVDLKEIEKDFKIDPRSLEAEFEKEFLAREVAELIGTQDVIPEVWDISREGRLQIATPWEDGKNWNQAGDREVINTVNNLSDRQYTDIVITEAIIRNSDRHLGNAMSTDDGRLLLIDNGRSFSIGDVTGDPDRRAITEVMRFDANNRQLDMETFNWLADGRNRTRVINLVDDRGSTLGSAELLSFERRMDTIGKISRIAQANNGITAFEYFNLLDSPAEIDKAFANFNIKMAEKFNPHHVPAGVPEGGQFTTAGRAGLVNRPRKDASKFPNAEKRIARLTDEEKETAEALGLNPDPLARGFNAATYVGFIENKIYDDLAEKPKALSDSASDVLAEIEGNIVHVTTHEVGHLISDDGSPILVKHGDVMSINFTPSQWDEFEDNIFTHNHPSFFGDMALSSGDISSAIRENAFEIRAVTRTAIYRMQRPDNGWPSRSLVMRTLRSEWDNHQQPLKLLGFTRDNQPPKEVQSVALHNVVDRTMAKLDIPYSRELR